MISVLLGPMTDEVLLDDQEQAALQVMADSGLLPPLRLVRSVPPVDLEGVAYPAALP
ncbi:MAG TPA: hypothetical protein VFW55_10700 [Propionicimonas sp.]|nr:hypothetical protein [Propionicimonas sp.]